MLVKSVNKWVRRLVLLAALLCAISCARREQVPSPESAVSRYVEAIQSADAEALHSMMTERARLEYSTKEIAALLARDKGEFAERARQLSLVATSVSGEATVYIAGGRSAALQLQGGKFWIRSAGLVPAMPRTPEEAAESLRQAVEKRDYTEIERTLSHSARAEFAEAFDALEESLSELDSAIVHVREDQATIEFLDGRKISLRREGAVWRVESFE